MLILASQSPRRREILKAAGIEFVIRSAGVPERQRPGESAVAMAKRLAEDKAAAAMIVEADDIVLGADTVVSVDEHSLGKPEDHADAARMLRLLSGREHDVITGICLMSSSRKVVESALTRVRFVRLTAREIDEYVASGEPMDKAGAYAIQGLACKFVDWIEGDYFNVMGLPAALVYRLLREF